MCCYTNNWTKESVMFYCDFSPRSHRQYRNTICTALHIVTFTEFFWKGWHILGWVMIWCGLDVRVNELGVLATQYRGKRAVPAPNVTPPPINRSILPWGTWLFPRPKQTQHFRSHGFSFEFLPRLRQQVWNHAFLKTPQFCVWVIRSGPPPPISPFSWQGKIQ